MTLPDQVDTEIAQSADLVAENIEVLKELFPDVVNDGKVDFETLRQLLRDEVDDGDEKFGLNWHGKRRARQLALTPSTGTLRPAPDDSVEWDTTQHLMIEGDNLEVLKLLQKSYSGRVKLIYIDPPYNTGGDFVYEDDFKDSIKNYLEVTAQTDEGRKVSTNTESSGRYHTDWLSMMYPRLKLARQLLSEDGVIFISIDDTEAAHLRSVADEIFGEDNFVANLIWQKKFARQNDALYYSTMHDHILCFARSSVDGNPNGWTLALLPRTEEDNEGYTNPDDDPRGPWTSVVLSAKSGNDKLVYEIETPSGRKVLPPEGRYWSVSPTRLDELIQDNRIWFGVNGDGIPRLKTFLSEVQSGIRPNTIWFHSEVSHNQEARQSLKKLFDGKGVFDSPKPVDLIRRMLKLADEQSDFIAMDFFAGSGTTGHAVMAQNAEDGGNRRYILVQLPEPLDPENKDQRVAAEFCDKIGKPRNIAELTKERLRRAATKIREEQPDYDGDLGFRVFKLDASNIRAWDPQPEDLEDTLLEHVDHLKEDRSEQDVLYELLLKLGLDLCVPIETKTIADHTVHSIGAGTLFTCLEETLNPDSGEDLALGIVEWRDQLDPAGDTTVVFRDSAFSDDVTKSNTDAILRQHDITNVRSI